MRFALALLLVLPAAPALAAGCKAESGEKTVALVELYTSEGCSSCPPADRWLSALAERGFAPDRVVPLALHVDYWDYIGWKDPFAKALFSARQRELAAIARSRVVYTPQVVLAGKDYGMGSSRDWAAKGVFLLGVKAVIAESFERIHRSNLVGMGVLPLVYKKGQNRSSLGLTGIGAFEIFVDDTLKPGQDVKVRVTNREGDPIEFATTCRIDTPVELEYYRNGGILQTVLRQLLKGGR